MDFVRIPIRRYMRQVGHNQDKSQLGRQPGPGSESTSDSCSVSSTIKHARSSVRVILSRCNEESRRANGDMKLTKVAAIVLFLAMGAALIGLRANAQQPTPLPHVQLAMPVAPPRGWDAKMWADVRARCQGIADRAAAHLPRNYQEMMDAKGICMDYVPSPPPATHGAAQPDSRFKTIS